MKKTPRLFVVVLLLAGAEVAGQAADVARGPEPAVADKYPAFRWDTVPTWLRVRKRTAYSDEELARIAEYPIVVFEKANGYETYGDVESGTLAAARGVKRINPATKTIFYLNAVIEYGSYRANEEFDRNADRWAVRKGGQIFRFKDRYHIFDLAEADVRDWWVRLAAGMAAHAEIDGVFIDALCKVPGYGEAYTAGYWKMATRLRRELGPDKLLVANALRVSEPNWNLDHLDYLDGTYVERWSIPMHGESYADYVAKSIEAMQRTVDRGKLVLFSAGPAAYGRETMGLDGEKDRDQMRAWMREHVGYPLAVFLIVAGERCYFDWTYTPDALLGVLEEDYEEFQRPLGRPLTEAKRDGYIYTRQFEHVGVRVDIENKTAELAWR